ncbi:hypothetical protein FB192DRAFT_1470930 [Mucor lusitanicus]|uniref:Reverse transcriptase zinc-binding domain-containing protein n=2 Tax=Mucor circinelloides f. lusitanicus TaxID=29924 RepID=A0A162Y8W7_MUCCL|nr:hypothetical protein FB192DRAFT_1470930 [Mucor lusitanicus]OAC97836.1 hypothetical protein MUCCIDRAFT_115910 [Mucor lusitanicus CBS 277.49]
MPTVFVPPNCLVCLSAIDSASHLLFDCPTKEKIWQCVVFEFLWPTTSIHASKEALLSLDFSNLWYRHVKGISPYTILLICLSKIWLAHMRFVFDKIVIVPESVLVIICSAVRQTVEEDHLHSQL